jgi:hypothetical protein
VVGLLGKRGVVLLLRTCLCGRLAQHPACIALFAGKDVWRCQ